MFWTGISEDELQSVTVERNLWDSFLDLFAPQPNLGQVEKDGGMDR